MPATWYSDWPDAHGFHQDDVVARRFAQQHGFAGFLGDATEGARGRRGADEAPSRRDSSSMRVLSPRMLPPAIGELGSTASTATRLPCSSRCRPKASMKVDLPTPGIPVMPMRILLPVWGRHCSRISWARSR